MFRGGARGLEDHRDELVSLLAPAGKALEAIDDFIHILVGRHNADRQLRGLTGKQLRCSRS